MQVNELNIEHTEDWASLLSVCFERTTLEMCQLLHWLHQGFKMIAWGGWIDGRLVAQYACVIRQLYLPSLEHEVEVGMSINMAVHPDYRGKGLIKHLAQPVYETVHALGGTAGVGFSNAAGVHVDRRSSAYGYQVCGQLTPNVVSLFMKRGKPLLELTDSWNTIILHPALFSNAGAIHFTHDERTLIHRYQQHPFRRYRFGIWHEGDCVLGIVIYREVQLMGMRAVALLGAYSVDLSELMHRFTTTIRDTGVTLIHFLSSPNSQTRAALAKIARLMTPPRTRTPYYLTVKLLTESSPVDLFNFAEWDSSGGDVL